MHSESKMAFLLVRHLKDLKPANEELAAYLSILQRISSDTVCGAIQGIWVDDEGVANLPSTLVLPGSGGERCSVRIVETMGINGIWMLCWLETSADRVSRIDLAAALLERFYHEVTAPAKLAARFIPVFPSNRSSSSAKVELRALDACYPGLVLTPAYQDEDGRLLISQIEQYKKVQSA